MMRYVVWFAYDGTRYHGWQIQPNGVTVQQVLQEALSRLLKTDITVVGAGRTDSGVHARQMAAHFDVEQALDGKNLAYRLNRILPYDVKVYDVCQVPEQFHARFSAIKRTYHYYVHRDKDPFLRMYSCELHYDLDFALMNEAAQYLLQVSDFGAFCKSHTDVKTTLCDVTEARWVQVSDHAWYFVISANRFLRNMVRAVVGTLIEVGRHRMTLEQFRDVVAGKNRSDAGESMPGHALFLERVEYALESMQYNINEGL